MKTKRTIMPTLIGAVAVGSAFFFVLSSEPVPPIPKNRLEQHCLTIVKRAKSGRARDLIRLRREFPDLFYQYKEYAIEVLESMGTPAARDLLLDIACRKVKAPVPLDESAAWSFWFALKDRSEARRLFAAPNPNVREKVLECLRKAHVLIDADMLRSLEPMLQDAKLVVRSQAAMYLGTAPGPASGTDKTRALIRCAETTGAQPGANKPGGFVTDIADIWTMADMVYLDVIRALARAEGINVNIMKKELPRKPGVARDCVLIAMALRGASETKPELYRILRRSEVSMLRARAVVALGEIGTAEDIAKLEQVAETDPFRVPLEAWGKRLYKSHNPKQSEAPEAIYPIRDLARAIARNLEDKWHGAKRP